MTQTQENDKKRYFGSDLDLLCLDLSHLFFYKISS